MEWTYADSDPPVSEGFTSEILDIYGYFLFAAPFMTMIPGFVNKAVEKCTGSKTEGDFVGLVIMFTVCALGCIQVSAQMCYQVIFIN